MQETNTKHRRIEWTKFIHSSQEESEGDDLALVSPMAKLIRNFKFWEGNTTFRLNEAILEEIEDVPGVEFLRVITDYKFIVGIGSLFADRLVKEKISKKIT